MNWFWFALIALICWSGSDLFSKIGCCGEKDKTAHLKMVVAVGIVMGLHAAYMIVFHHVSVTWDVVWTYLPVSLLYILSMTLGYVGLRYIELSISSPICNSSGALVAVLCLCTGALSDYNGPQKAVILCAVGLVCLGVVGLGVVEAREDDDLRRRRQEHANRKYAKSWLAICLPVAYCLLDAAGTFADSLVLERLNEDLLPLASHPAGSECPSLLQWSHPPDFHPEDPFPPRSQRKNGLPHSSLRQSAQRHACSYPHRRRSALLPEPAFPYVRYSSFHGLVN